MEPIKVVLMGELPPGTVRYHAHVHLGKGALGSPVGFTSETLFNAAEAVALAIQVARLTAPGIGSETEIRDHNGRTLVVFVPQRGGLVPVVTKYGRVDDELVEAVRAAVAQGLPQIGERA